MNTKQEITIKDLSVECSDIELCGNNGCAHNSNGYCKASVGQCYGFAEAMGKEQGLSFPPKPIGLSIQMAKNRAALKQLKKEVKK